MLGLTALTAGATPLEALRRIALLLERSRAGTYRVQAFRSAADLVSRMPSDELAARVESGSLEELPGIGASTAAVVTDAAHGELPAYLSARRSARPLGLERRRVVDPGDGAGRSRIRPGLDGVDRPLATPQGRSRAVG